MDHYVNLSLRALARRPELLHRHLRAAQPPELGLDPVLLDAADDAWHAATASALDAAGLARAVHLPFFDLRPGSIDPLIRQASRQRLAHGLDVALTFYRPAHLVAHAAYDRFLYLRSYEDWRDRAAEDWAALLGQRPSHPPVFFENTHETDPRHVVGLVEAVRSRLGGASAERIGLCLDIGHWHSFAGGAGSGDLAEWVAAFGPYLGHLHLHDNDGTFDQHRAPGRGRVPFEALYGLLEAQGLCPTATFEPHTDEDFAGVLAYVRSRPDRFGERWWERSSG